MTNTFLNAFISPLLGAVPGFHLCPNTYDFSCILYFTTAAKITIFNCSISCGPRINMRLETKVKIVANAGILTLANFFCSHKTLLNIVH